MDNIAPRSRPDNLGSFLGMRLTQTQMSTTRKVFLTAEMARPRDVDYEVDPVLDKYVTRGTVLDSFLGKNIC